MPPFRHRRHLTPNLVPMRPRFTDIARILLFAKADPSVQSRGDDRNFPLLYAADKVALFPLQTLAPHFLSSSGQGNEELVKMLLEWNADVNMKNSDDSAALHRAAYTKHNVHRLVWSATYI